MPGEGQAPLIYISHISHISHMSHIYITYVYIYMYLHPVRVPVLEQDLFLT